MTRQKFSFFTAINNGPGQQLNQSNRSILKKANYRHYTHKETGNEENKCQQCLVSSVESSTLTLTSSDNDF